MLAIANPGDGVSVVSGEHRPRVNVLCGRLFAEVVEFGLGLGFGGLCSRQVRRYACHSILQRFRCRPQRVEILHGFFGLLLPRLVNRLMSVELVLDLGHFFEQRSLEGEPHPTVIRLRFVLGVVRAEGSHVLDCEVRRFEELYSFLSALPVRSYNWLFHLRCRTLIRSRAGSSAPSRCSV